MRTHGINFRRSVIIAIFSSFIFTCNTQADTNIAVLDFELKDLTLLPGTPKEVKRTASIAPFLREALTENDDLQLVAIGSAAQSKANVAFGYLFDRPEVTAKLGEEYGADYVAVGRLHKASFLFVYLKVHLVDVKAKQLVGDYVVEIKGYLEKLARRGAASLAKQIIQRINASDTAMPPEAAIPAVKPVLYP